MFIVSTLFFSFWEANERSNREVCHESPQASVNLNTASNYKLIFKRPYVVPVYFTKTEPCFVNIAFCFIIIIIQGVVSASVYIDHLIPRGIKTDWGQGSCELQCTLLTTNKDQKETCCCSLASNQTRVPPLNNDTTEKTARAQFRHFFSYQYIKTT